eukprot:CAMPEP_0175827822 /NCGR_PEP_ID=MMETSP0107_2-20121207/12482_1 /TAXON_ID=195067 ORGANISM="Goniomonas pacifica, Strain CCMP1869" /NCGR_SAMPLE_ID=MMETSP0107_2 /ASSEMBLY_ACC=CAM_ASM_000203 /LENGTH=184 /DNA_ID=CAMNT_0017140511 /DNA_START=18 /DNA_END=572 /DNA_ORIENTATION=-
MDLAGFLELLSCISLGISMFGSIGTYPEYNLVIALMGLYVSSTQSKRCCYLLGIFISLSFFVDLLWAVVPERKDVLSQTDTFRFSLACLVFNMIVKAGAAFFVFRLFTDLGGVWTDFMGNRFEASEHTSTSSSYPPTTFPGSNAPGGISMVPPAANMGDASVVYPTFPGTTQQTGGGYQQMDEK